MATKKAAASSSGEPKKRTTCKTCNGHGATDLVPMNARNTEAHYNKYGTSLKLGVAGGSHMGATCVGCGGGGLAK
jgi:hypothetical protein